MLDVALWNKCEVLVEMSKPICDLLDLSNTVKPVIGKIYHHCFLVQEKLLELET